MLDHRPVLHPPPDGERVEVSSRLLDLDRLIAETAVEDPEQVRTDVWVGITGQDLLTPLRRMLGLLPNDVGLCGAVESDTRWQELHHYCGPSEPVVRQGTRLTLISDLPLSTDQRRLVKQIFSGDVVFG